MNAPARYFLPVLRRALVVMGVLTLARVVLVARFAGGAPAASLTESFVMGARFDARLAAWYTLATAPVLYLAVARSGWAKAAGVHAIRALDAFAGLGLAVFLVSDFAHYAYLKERLNAGVITLAVDWREAAGMVWQSYPVVLPALGVAAFTVGFVWIQSRCVARAGAPVESRVWPFAARVFGLLALVLAAIFGRAGQYPLRWSEAASIEPKVAADMALNPVLYFLDTLDFARKGYRTGDDLPYRADMAARLGADAAGAGGLRPYDRVLRGDPAGLERRQNVVLVIMESFSGYKSSVFGNPLDPTPVMKRVADAGVLFDRHFTATSGTARGVFTLTTGVTDVELGNTASRNPRAARHPFILEDYGFAEKHYFIGGSTRWANVRAVLRGTLPGVKIHDEGGISSPSADVWGAADGDLLPEAAMKLAGAKRPFFAVIQTSSNHRPFTIPEAHLPHCPRCTFNKETLAAAGFESPEEYDGMRYMDWSIGRLLEEAKRAGWRDDTVFVFVGDHGIGCHAGQAGAHMPEMFSKLPFTQGHTPLVYYAPGRIAPGRISTPCIQADALPTLAGFFRGDFHLRCLGRDVRTAGGGEARPGLAFFIDVNAGPSVGVFDGRYFANTGIHEGNAVKLHDTASPDIAANIAAAEPLKAAELARWARAHYHVAAYMLTHNGDAPPGSPAP